MTETVKNQFEIYLNDFKISDSSVSHNLPDLMLKDISEVLFRNNSITNSEKMLFINPSIKGCQDVFPQSLSSASKFKFKISKQFCSESFRTAPNYYFPSQSFKPVSFQNFFIRSKNDSNYYFNSLTMHNIFADIQVKNLKNTSFYSLISSGTRITANNLSISSNLSLFRIEKAPTQYFKDLELHDFHSIIPLFKRRFIALNDKMYYIDPVRISYSLQETRMTEDLVQMKQCVVNGISIKDIKLIEGLNYNNWTVYDRLDTFEKVKILNVREDGVLAIIPISQLADDIAILADLVLIVELETQKQLMEYSAEIIRLREVAREIYFSQSLEEIFKLIENLAMPFKFHQDETMEMQSKPRKWRRLKLSKLMYWDDPNKRIMNEGEESVQLSDEEFRKSPSVFFSTTNSKIISSKSLLLRLFQSELFTAVQALHYLQKYSNEPGIQYYLCERLKAFPEQEVEIIIPQLCHLAVMNSFESAPIEQFLLDLAKGSLHASIQILWILESYLLDLKVTNRNAEMYLRAARIILEIQKASFRHEVSDSSFNNTKKLLSRAHEHLENFYGATAKNLPRVQGNPFLCTGPPIVAFGVMISAIGYPEMVRTMRPLIAMQTRKSDPFDRFHDHISNKLRVSPILGANNTSNVPSSPCSSTKTNYSEISSFPSSNSESSGPSLEELSKGKAFSLKRYITKTAKNAKTLLNSQAVKSPPLPLMSNEMIEGIPKSPPATLFPTIPLYYHGEMQFVSSLIAVSDRLVTLTRPNRLKALHAELCLINHNLPAPICVHSWCSKSEPSRHNRILSIFPYESSILNSAERVPFIIFIEILKDCPEDSFNAIIQESKVEYESAKGSSMDELKHSPIQNFASDSPVEIESQPLEVTNYEAKASAIATPSGLIDVSERMRTAAVMLAQLAKQSQVPNADVSSINSIRTRIIREMETLEKDRLIDALQIGANERRESTDIFDDQIVKIDNFQRPKFDKHDPSASVFQEDWDTKKQRLAKNSPYGALAGWDVFSVIVKSSTDMRQELLAFQLVREYQKIFIAAELDIFIRPCKVLVGANGGGLIETVPNAISIHSIKKSILMSLERAEFTAEDLSLKGYFIRKFGTPDSFEYCRAVDNFIKSLAGYSLLTYTLQIRDRHNGNILLDRDGNIIHIDFGFMLSNSPGYVGFESAPFKLTADYLDLLDGIGSPRWIKFKALLAQGLLALRKHSDQLVSILEVLLPNSNLPCFYAGEAALLNFKERLHLTLTDQQIHMLIDKLMTTSALNVFTRLYDNYQYYTNGIL